jgi:hypothetical protein
MTGLVAEPIARRQRSIRNPTGNRRLVTIFETSGSALAIAYALLIASNSGLELLGFALLLVSSGLFAAWAAIDKRWAFLGLQFFYALSATIGLIRWA